MILEDVLTRVRNGTCAIGYITVPLDSYTSDPLKPFFKVVGTGFVVRSTSVITNRHVVEALAQAKAEFGFPDEQRILVFVAPDEPSGFRVIIRTIRRVGVVAHPDLDVAFVEFQREPEPQFTGIHGLEVSKGWNTKVTEAVALCGYPYGHAMLQRRGRVYRWGPIIQQGHVSAISPFDTFDPSGIPDEVLLDVRVAGGMSGAPIFRPHDGLVVGILHSGWEATTALGLPLTDSVVKKWLAEYDKPTPP